MSQKKTIVIVGGVAGGASAATRARRLDEDAEIIVIERDHHVSFANCGLPYAIGGEIGDRRQLLVSSAEILRRRFRLDVRLRHEVTAIDRESKSVEVRDLENGAVSSLRYDKLILSPGAAPLMPEIPGIRARGVFSLRSMEDMDAIVAALPAARRAVVAGGGFIGLEVAEQLHRRGLSVHLIEKNPQVLPLLDPEMAEPLHRELIAKGIGLSFSDALAEIENRDGAATALITASGQRIEGDLFILGLGVRPVNALARAAELELAPDGGILVDRWQRSSDPDIYAVGDAATVFYAPTSQSRRVALGGPANRHGRLAGEHAVLGEGAPSSPVQGTAIVRVFDLAAGLCGLSLKAAKAARLDAVSVHGVSYHHASYFPGARRLLSQLVFERISGRLLGLQVVGEEGVDKRLDVFAALLHKGGTVADLCALDLAYAPPFGAAKDPLHQLGFAADNALRGFSRFVAPDSDLSRYQVIDVRPLEEALAKPLAAAQPLAIPLDELRQRLGELDRAKPTLVSCAGGIRAHHAARILMQKGFHEVAILSGCATFRDLAVNRSRGASAKEAVAAPAAKTLAGPASCSAGVCGDPPRAASASGENISPAELASQLAAGQAWNLIDVRSPAEFRGGHVRGAQLRPLDALDPAALRAERKNESPFLILCKSGGRAGIAAKKLREAGLPCRVVSGGTDACAAAGLPIDTETSCSGGGCRGVISLERQVRIAAGFLVLSGALLGHFVHPGFYGLSGFVGAGLIFAGITDFCGMGLLIARMPWNR
ncbi:MAG: hypothetical protein RL095_1882 [Verrucomicrobiota bacterium]|jgi:NADPH-dependent 2,4-dienoyl-CoA reductase/sulfur reductase-like enzyme/rhodanese-related sulfurtransferase